MKKYRLLVAATALSTLGLGAMIVGGDKLSLSDPPEKEYVASTLQSGVLRLDKDFLSSLQHGLRPSVRTVEGDSTVEDSIVNDSTSVDNPSTEVTNDTIVVKTWPDWTSDNQGIQGSSSEYSWTMEGPAGYGISFDWSVSSENGCDILEIFCNGSSMGQVSGENQGTVTAVFDQDFSMNFRAVYSKDGSVDHGYDCARITNIRVFTLDPMASVSGLLAQLENFPNLKILLQEAADQYEAATTQEEKVAAAQVLNATISEVQRSLNFYQSVQSCIAQAEAILASDENAADVAACLEALQAIDLDKYVADADNEVLKALQESIAVYNASVVPMEEWNFGGTMNFGGEYWAFDEEHRLAAFYGFTGSNNATSFTIPAIYNKNGVDYAVVAVGSANYYNSQDSLQVVNLPSSIRRIENNAFRNYRSVAELTLPENVEYIGDGAFAYMPSLRELRMLSKQVPVLGGSSNLTSQKVIVRIPDGCFHAYRIANNWGNCLLVSKTPVEITVDVATPGELGLLALNEAGYLQEINKIHVSGELNADDWSNLKGMSNLIEVDLNGVLNTYLPAGQFKDKWAITQVQVPAGLQTIGAGAFWCSGIQQIDLPGTLQQINGGAFYECTSLQSVVIPDGVSQWGNQEYVTNWGYISNSIFYNCYSLSSVNIPTGVTSIPDGTFYNCNLQEVVIPDNIKSIGSNAFYINDYLTRVHLSEGLTTIGERAFSGCWSLDSLQMPSTLASVSGWAFSNCSSLHTVQLNEGLTDIWGWAFENCHSLEEVILPSSLRKCWQSPFSGCNNLKKIYARSVIPAATNNYCPLSSNDFNGAVLYVPVWSLQEYQLADGWKQFVTVETHDYMPENVFINKDFTFALRDTLAADYRPNIYLEWTNTRGQDSYGQDYYEHGNLTINSRSKLPVNQFSMHVSPLAKYSSDENENNRLNGWNSNYMTEWNSNSLIVNGEMRAEDVDLMYTFKETRWNFISVPFDVDMKDFVQADSNTQWVIREYSGANRANGIMDSTWVNVGRDGVLKAGKGYALHLTGGGVDFHVKPLTESVNRQAIFIAADREVPLEENLSEFEHNRSWNLIGNPFPCFYDTRFLDFEAPITVWNSYRESYVAYSPVDDSYILSPGEAFFVQRPVDQEQITFAKEGRQTHMHPRIVSEVPAKQAALDATPRLVYNITLTGEEGADRTRVVLNEKAEAGYELNRDASKFMSTNPNVPQLFTLEGNVRYAINERPMADAEVQLGVYIGKAGEYTLALAKGMTGELIVEDRLLGTFTAISAEEGYTFTAEAGQITDRFVLHFADGNTTGIADAAASADENAPAYNVAGQAVNAKTFKGVIVQKGRKLIKK